MHVGKKIPDDVDDILVPLVLDVLECNDPAISRTPRTSLEPYPIDRTPSGSSADAEVTTTWRSESPTGRVRVERTYYFFPGDVNEPPLQREYVDVHVDLDGKPKVKVHAAIGYHELSITVEEAPKAERIAKAIAARLESVFGRY